MTSLRGGALIAALVILPSILAGCARVEVLGQEGLCATGERSLHHAYTPREIASALRHAGPPLAEALRQEMVARIANRILIAGNESFSLEGAIRHWGTNEDIETGEPLTQWAIEANASWPGGEQTFYDQATVVNSTWMRPYGEMSGSSVGVPVRWSREAAAVAREHPNVTALDPDLQNVISARWEAEEPGCVVLAYGRLGTTTYQNDTGTHGHMPPQPVLRLWYDMSERSVVRVGPPG